MIKTGCLGGWDTGGGGSVESRMVFFIISSSVLFDLLSYAIKNNLNGTNEEGGFNGL